MICVLWLIMTSVTMCLEVADEANLGKEASPTVIGQRWEDAVLLVLVALALHVVHFCPA